MGLIRVRPLELAQLASELAQLGGSTHSNPRPNPNPTLTLALALALAQLESASERGAAAAPRALHLRGKG